MAISRSQALSNELKPGRSSGSREAPRPRSSQSPEDVVRMLLLAAPDAGRPPPEIVGAALKAAGVPINDENLIRALEEAAGCRGGTPSREDVGRARSGAHDYKFAPRENEGSGSEENGGLKAERPGPEIKYYAPTIPAITFNNGLAQMHKKPVQAMRLLETMRASMPDVAALQRMSQLHAGSSFILPQGPEEVVRTLCQVAPDAGRPPPEVVGAALKAAGFPATAENLEKALREAKGCAPSKEDMAAASAAAEQYGQPPGYGSSASSRSGYGGSVGSTSGSTSRPSSSAKPEDVIQALLAAAPGLGQPPPEVVGMALRQAGISVNEDTARRALCASGDRNPSQQAIRVALAAGQEDE